jgi:hypothetical protein
VSDERRCGVFDAAAIGMTRLISEFLHGLLDLLGDLLRSAVAPLEDLVREVLDALDISSLLSGTDRDGVQEGYLLQTSKVFRDHSCYPSSVVEEGIPILVVKRLEHGAMLLIRGRLSFWDYELIARRTRPIGVP